MIELHCGDCLEILPTLERGSIDCVVTSPPYAEQRKGLYDGVPEHLYPEWTVRWMDTLRPALRPQASVLINIREHVKDGQISDYVLRTRLALREAGWIECDELIWIKPDSPPVGHVGRPRRSWERVLWFSQSTHAWCDPKANGKTGSAFGALSGRGLAQWQHAGNGPMTVDISRCKDVIDCRVGSNENGGHPAAYPIELASWMIKLVCPEGGTVLEPFAGSGTTAIAAHKLGRNCVAIEKDSEYFAIAQKRIADAQMQPMLELTA